MIVLLLAVTAKDSFTKNPLGHLLSCLIKWLTIKRLLIKFIDFHAQQILAYGDLSYES